MKLNSIFILLIFNFSFFVAFSQNTNEPGVLTPDTSKNKNLNIPTPNGNGGGIQKMEELELKEEAPNKSEPVPGAEILIEQSSEDIPTQSSKPVKAAIIEDKDKTNKNTKKPKNK